MILFFVSTLDSFTGKVSNLLLPFGTKGAGVVRTPPPVSFTKGGTDFLRFGNNGGDKIFFLEKEGFG